MEAGAAFEGVVREVVLDAPEDPLLQGMDLDPWQKHEDLTMSLVDS